MSIPDMCAVFSVILARRLWVNGIYMSINLVFVFVLLAIGMSVGFKGTFLSVKKV
jgi:hypothetical protein